MAMKSFLRFFRIMFSEWASGMSGPASVPLAMLALFVKEDIQRFSFASLALILGFVSAYRIWLKEHLRAEKELEARLLVEDKSLPKLAVRFDSVMVAHNQSHEALLTVLMVIENRGAPSIVNFGKITVNLPGRGAVVAKLIMPSLGNVKLPGRDGYPNTILRREDYLPEKATNQPVPTGGSVAGWTISLVPGVSQEEMSQPNTTVMFECTDINGQLISATREMGQGPEKIYFLANP